MSKFSNYLKCLIDRSGQSISSLSRLSGVERTSIHKALTDERILAYKSVEKLVRVFCLSPQEKTKLLKYHSMLLQGEELFESRKNIADILRKLADLPSSAPAGRQSQSSSLLPLSIADGQMFHGEIAVTDISKSVLDLEIMNCETPCVYLNFSLEDSFLQTYIFLLYRQVDKAIDIRHIVPFPYLKNMETSTKYGLRLLEWILPLCLAADNHYRPYFYYEHAAAPSYSDPMPYFILTGGHLLCLAQDMKTAVLYTNPSLISYYRQYTLDMAKQCEPLLTCSKGPFDILEQYVDYSMPDGYYTIMPQPCFGKFYTRDFITSKVPRELPFYETLVDAADTRFQLLRDLNSNYYTLFTYEGLLEFCKNGIFCDMPREYVKACTPAERLSMMQSLREGMADGSITGMIVNPAALQIPEYLTFTISPDKGIHIFTTTAFRKEAYYSNLHIVEPIISRAFFDFIVSLPDSEYVYPKEDTLKIVDDLIEMCKKLQGSDGI